MLAAVAAARECVCVCVCVCVCMHGCVRVRAPQRRIFSIGICDLITSIALFVCVLHDRLLILTRVFSRGLLFVFVAMFQSQPLKPTSPVLPLFAACWTFFPTVIELRGVLFYKHTTLLESSPLEIWSSVLCLIFPQPFLVHTSA